jgi:hypothetical protein
MPYYKFQRNDVFHNQIKAHPTVNFDVVTGTIYYNNEVYESGTIPPHSTVDTYQYVKGVPVGNISLYELNINRSGSDIYPFVHKNSSLVDFKTASTASFSFAGYGDTLVGSYPMSASISSDYYPAVAAVHRRSGSYFGALGVPLSMSNILSPHYQFTSDLGDKGTQELRLISIPSIFYGSSVKKGSMSLKFYVTGTLIGELTDELKRGELRQVATSSDGVTETPSGSVAGVVLYNEGFIILTGSWPLYNHIEDYTGTPAKPRWIDFATINTGLVSSSFQMNFSGTSFVPNVTMMATAPKGELNQSNNPTFIEYGQSGSILAHTSSVAYIENNKLSIKNVTQSKLTASYASASFEKTTYISKIGLYDKDRNLIGIAKLANPVRKREIDEFTFKLKLDF